MNDQEPLDELGTALDPPSEHAPIQVRQRVLAGLTVNRYGPARWQRPVWRVATAGGLAVLVTAGIFVLSAPWTDDQSTASDEATEILLAAADSALTTSTEAPRSDQFVFIESQTWYPTSGQRSGSGLTRTWRSADGSRDGLIWTELPSPNGETQTRIPGCRDGYASEWTGQGTLADEKTRACQPDPAYVSDPPTTPNAMLSHLIGLGGVGDDDELAFANAGTMLMTDYLTSQTRMTLYQAIALIPGVTALNDVTDANGRPGVAVAREANGVLYEMLFDTQTHQFLGWQLEPVDEGLISTARSQAILRIAIVDSSGQIP